MHKDDYVVLEKLQSSSIFYWIFGAYLGSWSLSSGAGYGLNYLTNIFGFLSCIIFFLLVKKKSKIFRSVELGIVFLITVFFLFIVFYLLAIVRDGFYINILIKSILWFFPISVILVLSSIKIDRKSLLRSWFYVGLLFNIIFTFFIASFNYRIGKFYADINGFEISSNSLSIYLIFTVVIPGLLYFKSRILIIILLLLPLIHFSKSHIMMYFFSIFFCYFYYKKKLLMLLFSLLITIFALSLIGLNFEYVYSLLPVELHRSLGKIIILCRFISDLLYEGRLPSFLFFITEVGDGLRASIYEYAFSNWRSAWPLGMSDSSINEAFYGYDFHNMFIFFYYQLGGMGLALFSILILTPLIIAKNRSYNFIIAFSVCYIFLRSFFISIDPYRMAVLFIVLIFLLDNQRSTNES